MLFLIRKKEKSKPPRIIATVVIAKTQAKYIETIIKKFLLLAYTDVTKRNDIIVSKENTKLKIGFGAYSGYGKLQVQKLKT